MKENIEILKQQSFKLTKRKKPLDRQLDLQQRKQNCEPKQIIKMNWNLHLLDNQSHEKYCGQHGCKHLPFLVLLALFVGILEIIPVFSYPPCEKQQPVTILTEISFDLIMIPLHLMSCKNMPGQGSFSDLSSQGKFRLTLSPESRVDSYLLSPVMGPSSSCWAALSVILEGS